MLPPSDAEQQQMIDNAAASGALASKSASSVVVASVGASTAATALTNTAKIGRGKRLDYGGDLGQMAEIETGHPATPALVGDGIGHQQQQSPPKILSVSQAVERTLTAQTGPTYPEMLTAKLGTLLVKRLHNGHVGASPQHWALHISTDEMEEGAVPIEGESDTAVVANTTDTATAGGGVGGVPTGAAASAAPVGGVGEEEGEGDVGPRLVYNSKRRRSSVDLLEEMNGMRAPAARHAGAGTIELQRELAFVKTTFEGRFAVEVEASLGMFETVQGGCLLWCTLIAEGLPRIPALAVHIVSEQYPHSFEGDLCAKLLLTFELTSEGGEGGFQQAVKHEFDGRIKQLLSNISISTALQTLENCVRSIAAAAE